MSRVMLLRHAKAQFPHPGMQDFDRPLAPEGKEDLDRLAAAMKQAAILPQLIIALTARRTRETTDYLLSALIPNVVANVSDIETPGVETNAKFYSGDAHDYLTAINNADKDGHYKNVMLVGHNPTMEDLALALSAQGESDAMNRLQAGFPTAGLAIIRFDMPFADVQPGTGFLEFFLIPAFIQG